RLICAQCWTPGSGAGCAGGALAVDPAVVRRILRAMSCACSARAAAMRFSQPGTGGCALAAGWAGGGGGSAGPEAGGTYRAIPCRGSQANAHGAGTVERGEAAGMTRRSTRIALGVLGIRLRARSGFGRYTELSNTR